MKIIALLIVIALAACLAPTDGVSSTSHVGQHLCTQDDIDNGVCNPSYSWAQIQSYASWQPYNYAASNYPDATDNVSGGCRSTDGALTCHAHLGVPGTNLRYFVICDVVYTVEYVFGPPPDYIAQVVYQVHSVNCRAQRD